MIERKKSWWGGGTEVHVWRKRSERERSLWEGVEKSMCRGKGVGEREVGGERVGSCMVGDEG